MILLEGKGVAQNLEKDFETRIKKLNKKPFIAVLGIEGDEASLTYIKRIQKNCEKYGIKFLIKISKNEEEYVEVFNGIINNVSTASSKKLI